MYRKVSAHCEKQEEHRKVSEYHDNVDRQKLIELSSYENEEIFQRRLVADGSFVLFHTLAFLVEAGEYVEFFLPLFSFFFLLKLLYFVERELSLRVVSVIPIEISHFIIPLQ